MFRSVCARRSLHISTCGLQLRSYHRIRAPDALDQAMEGSAVSYNSWSREDLLRRVRVLEQKLKDAGEKNNNDTNFTELMGDGRAAPSKGRAAKKPKTFDWSKHSMRFIALKFAYLGQRYNGFEHHANNPTPLPTIEETLWYALMKAKLINPSGDTSGQKSLFNWEGCDYSKCGRTDRGVSAFGQVVGLKVRSNRPLAQAQNTAIENDEQTPLAPAQGEVAAAPEFDDIADEVDYIQLLNGLLPPDIRVLAWCPSPPEGFSARFSCRARHYKYFFTQPAYMPTPGVSGLHHGPRGGTNSSSNAREGWLDISQMQEAAKRFEGLHDFRNFCKVDPSKQITDHRRRMFRSVIRPLAPEELPASYIAHPLFARTGQSATETTAPQIEDESTPQIYVFDLQGSAFLWHQVRCMIAVLFLVGQGLESPALIDRLLDIAQCPEKPMYELASDTPLVLWDCIFPTAGSESTGSDADPLQDSLQWVYVGEGPLPRSDKDKSRVYSTKYGLGGAVDTAWSLWRESQMDAILRGSMLNLIARQPDVLAADAAFDPETLTRKRYSQKVFDGAAAPRYIGTYTPMMQRERMRPVEVLNREYAEKRGIEPKMKKDGEVALVENRGDHMEVEP